MSDDVCIHKCVGAYLFHMQDIFVKRCNVATRQSYVTKLLMENGVAHLSYLLFKGKDAVWW